MKIYPISKRNGTRVLRAISNTVGEIEKKRDMLASQRVIHSRCTPRPRAHNNRLNDAKQTRLGGESYRKLENHPK